jgi:hypothetical protein
MIRNQSGQVATGEVVNATTGAGFVGAVTCYVTLDGIGPTLGSVGGGAASTGGQGVYIYHPSAAETNAASASFTFVGTGAVPSTTTYEPLTVAQNAALQSASINGSIALVSDLLTAVLKRINVVQGGQVATGDDLRDGFDFANLWLDSMANERLMIPFITRTAFTLTTSKGTPTNPYTVGLGGDINIAKPVFFEKLNYIDNSVTPANEIPIFMLTDQAYQGLVQKTLTSTYPIYGYYSPTYASGLGSLYVNPIPTSSTLTGVLYSPFAVQQFTSLTQTIVVPPGYKFFLQENLALFFSSTFRENLPADPGLVESARATKRNIKAMNLPMSDLAIDQGAMLPGHGYKSNIYTGQ